MATKTQYSPRQKAPHFSQSVASARAERHVSAGTAQRSRCRSSGATDVEERNVPVGVLHILQQCTSIVGS